MSTALLGCEHANLSVRSIDKHPSGIYHRNRVHQSSCNRDRAGEGITLDLLQSRDASFLVPGIEAVWARTLGDPQVCVAILDGPVDLGHASLQHAAIMQLPSLVDREAADSPAARHGTHVASILFGQHDGPVKGLAPRCRGVSIPVFSSMEAGDLRPCSQLDLARAIALAVSHGARVINVSGGQLAVDGSAYPLLAEIVRECARAGVLLIAAVGNEGRPQLHVPAALESVLAVGAMDEQGEPLPFSNWGDSYQDHGILAPGKAIPGARAGGGTARESGTSFATAIVSGVAALLLSLQLQRGGPLETRAVRAALLQSAWGCDRQPTEDCRRLLAGRLQVPGAVSILDQVKSTMTDLAVAPALESASPQPAAVPSAGCGCSQCGGTPNIYALGQLSYDLISEARLDSLVQKMAGQSRANSADRTLVFDPLRLLTYLEQNPWDAAAIEWTLHLDGTPIYAIRPRGPFAADTYRELRRFLQEQQTEGVERVSIPGMLSGKATLLLGHSVPVIVPELRGMYSWTTAALVESVVGPSSEGGGEAVESRKQGVRNFLDRVYYELRNLGVTPRERALNFAATNASETNQVFQEALKEKLELDRIDATRSPVGRPGSDCWDVELYFFYPERHVQTVRKVYRFTVDVSDVVPVTIGPMRSWFTR